MPENQNFYIIRHGIRLSGMPAWKPVLSEQQMWQVTTFLSHMDNLSTDISAKWKNAAGDTTGQPPQSDVPAHNSHTGMKM